MLLYSLFFSVISLDDSQYTITLNARLRHFVHIFMGLPVCVVILVFYNN